MNEPARLPCLAEGAGGKADTVGTAEGKLGEGWLVERAPYLFWKAARNPQRFRKELSQLLGTT